MQVVRIVLALTLLLSGFVLLPQTGLSAGTVEWQRFATVYEDTVTITRARYDSDKRELEVRATSTAATAQLRVYETSTNRLIGVMQRNSGEFRLKTTWARNPQSVTVRSSQGGSATARVTR